MVSAQTFRRFAVEFAKWLIGSRLTQCQDASDFVAEVITKESVGDVTELAGSAQLDTYFHKHRDLVGIDFELTKTGEMKLPCGRVAVSQPLLLLAHHVMPIRTISSEICAADNSKQLGGSPSVFAALCCTARMRGAGP